MRAMLTTGTHSLRSVNSMFKELNNESFEVCPLIIFEHFSNEGVIINKFDLFL